jgi:hypothetical protein
MLISRDSAIWWIGLIGGVITAITVKLDQFPWFSETARQWIGLAGVVVAAVSGKLATSPLPSGQAVAVGQATAEVVEAKRTLEAVKRENEPVNPDGEYNPQLVKPLPPPPQPPDDYTGRR